MSLHETIKKKHPVVPDVDYSRGGPAANLRRRLLTKAASEGLPLNPAALEPNIPEDDLKIITKIYFNKYEDCGRKRGALLRYIKHFRDTQQVPPVSKTVFRHIARMKTRTQPTY